MAKVAAADKPRGSYPSLDQPAILENFVSSFSWLGDQLYLEIPFKNIPLTQNKTLWHASEVFISKKN